VTIALQDGQDADVSDIGTPREDGAAADVDAKADVATPDNVSPVEGAEGPEDVGDAEGYPAAEDTGSPQEDTEAVEPAAGEEPPDGEDDGTEGESLMYTITITQLQLSPLVDALVQSCFVVTVAVHKHRMSEKRSTCVTTTGSLMNAIQ
jgi:hypothetical protein